jgi:hypothetical protein
MIKIHDQLIKVAFGLALLFFILQSGLLVVFWGKLPPQGPLFYSRPWGERQLATPQGYLILPLVSVLVLTVNLILSSLFPKQEKLISQLLMLFAAVFGFLCLFTLSKVIWLIT